MSKQLREGGWEGGEGEGEGAGAGRGASPTR